MKILFFGDIFGRSGRQAVRKIMSNLQAQHAPDFIIANIENLAHGRGVTPSSFEDVKNLGIDVFTGGNHSLENEQGLSLFVDDSYPLIRPMNMTEGTVGHGFVIVEKKGVKVMVFNLMGQLFMKKEYENPFVVAQKFLEAHKNEAKIIILDWHAEATSEKVAMGMFLDGQVSAVLGTHTHVPTADWKILQNGTGFVTDVGMCGPVDSIIGMKKSPILKEFLGVGGEKPDVADGAVEINAILLTIDENSGKTIKIEKIQQIVDNF